MARTWVYTKRNRLPLSLLNAAGRTASLARQRPRPAAGPVRRILVVEFWNIGDVVLALPFLAQVRAMFPEARITLLGQSHAAELLEHSDLVDEVIAADIPWTASDGKYDPRRYDWSALTDLFRGLREKRFDMAFESRMDPRAKIVLALSGARRRVGYDYGGMEWLLTDVVEYGSLDRHRIDDWTCLLLPFGAPESVPAPRLTVTKAEAAWARAWLSDRGVRRGHRVLVVHPGASSAIKRWPLDRFAAVVQQISSRDRLRIVAVEDPGGYGAELATLPGVIGIKPTLRQLLALLSESDALLCNDSGPMHMAAAVGTPIVGIFHPHAAREFSPFGDGHRILAPSERGVMPGAVPRAETLLRVSVADVLEAIVALLSRAPERRCATGS